jgi:hypothetical protein
VDDAWPGYRELLHARAASRHDLNPNRYRDNLDLLRYNLRSLERFVPWARRVFLVTCRPQVPSWLDTTTVTVVHHDQFMAAETLPTFNSFAIVSQLHRLPGLSRRFVYVEDDRLFGAPVGLSDLFHTDGRPLVYLKWRHTMDPGRRKDARLSPWNRALAYSNHLLNTRYGARRRPTVSHAPLPIDMDSWQAMIATWPDAFAHTAASPFRDTGNVAPEHLYPHYLLEERLGVPASRGASLRRTAYHPLNNVTLLQRASFARLRLQQPMFVCFNDNYGDSPSPAAVAIAREFLERWLPTPSRFELRRGSRD